MPLVPVVTLPEGTRADSPSVKADLAKVDQRLEKAHARLAGRLVRLHG